MRSMPTDSCTIARDRQAGHGSRIGILMLETSFMRIAGDMGNAATWPFPVAYRVVRGATAASVVLDVGRDACEGVTARLLGDDVEDPEPARLDELLETPADVG